jgi:hypothetical protein
MKSPQNNRLGQGFDIEDGLIRREAALNY